MVAFLLSLQFKIRGVWCLPEGRVRKMTKSQLLKEIEKVIKKLEKARKELKGRP